MKLYDFENIIIFESEDDSSYIIYYANVGRLYSIISYLYPYGLTRNTITFLREN